MAANFSEESLIKTAVLESKRQRPFLSGNDRSRWLTVRSLVELGTFEINDIVEYEPLWDSVDVVSQYEFSWRTKALLEQASSFMRFWLLLPIGSFKKQPAAP